MILSSLDPATSAVFWIAIKASLLLAVAGLAQVLIYRRASAAMRHLVWTLALVSVLGLPVLSLALPEWAVIRAAATSNRAAPPQGSGRAGSAMRAPVAVDARAQTAAPGMPADSRLAAPPSVEFAAGGFTAPVGTPTWTAVIATLYAAGVLVMLMHLAMQQWGIRRLAREGTLIQDPEWTRLLRDCCAAMSVARPVRLRRSRERNMPMTFGTLRPTIVIPAVADTWTDDRRRAVMLHELAHVARYDCLSQSVAFAACSLYWVHPLAWWASRRLRIERELACDDRVIMAGAAAREYAGHLLEIAYTFAAHRAPALAVSMARPKQLEGRLLAVLDSERNRTQPARRLRIAAAGIAATLLLPISMATSSAAATPHEEASMAAVPSQGVPEPQVTGPTLHRVELPFYDFARRVLHAAAAAFGVPQDKLPGTWEIRPTAAEGIVHLRLVELQSSSGMNVALQQLEGLTAAQRAGTGGSVQFRLRRDAGTFTFEGVFRSGIGAGTFSFAADATFPEALAKRGFARPTAVEQYQMARHDIGFAFVDELNAHGYAKPQTSELVRAGQHGVDVAYLREMAALGHRLGTLDPLIVLRDHGVTPTYVRELAEQGYKGLAADALRHARDHGVTPEYVRAMRDAGYGSLSMEQLTNTRDHGVTPQFIQELGQAGYRKLPLEDVIRVRDHGVTPEYIREMRQLGHQLPLDELVRARDHGVDVEFARAISALGYPKLPMESLVRMRDHGVTPQYIQELKDLGYDRLSIDDLVSLRDHGVTPDRIRAANARAGTRLPLDTIRSYVARGIR
jgi:beta-lactamase regulating signal transducer with metallopeptidase domain